MSAVLAALARSAAHDARCLEIIETELPAIRLQHNQPAAVIPPDEAGPSHTAEDAAASVEQTS